MNEGPAPWSRTMGWLGALGLALTAVVLGRVALDLIAKNAAFGACVIALFAATAAVAGANVASLVRRAPAGPPISAARRWALALAIPVALVGSMLDCMGLEFSGCTDTCGWLIRGVAPAVTALALLHAASGRANGLLGASLLAFALLIPNCVCRNPINRPWIELLGKSPACFVSSFGVIVVASSALASRRRVAASLVVAWSIVATLLAFWIGHHYFHFPW